MKFLDLHGFSVDRPPVQRAPSSWPSGDPSHQTHVASVTRLSCGAGAFRRRRGTGVRYGEVTAHSNSSLGLLSASHGLRYRDTHDFTHTLAGVGVSVEEELGVKMLEMMQTALPVTAIRCSSDGRVISAAALPLHVPRPSLMPSARCPRRLTNALCSQLTNNASNDAPLPALPSNTNRTSNQRHSVLVGQIKLSHAARMRLFTQWLPW
jgi:hypothetical protein